MTTDDAAPPARRSFARRVFRNPIARSAAMACASSATWATWAAYANFDHGVVAAMKASLTQGLLSLTETFFMTLVLETVSARLPYGFRKIALPPLAAVTTQATYTIAMHTLVGTPELVATITPVLLSGGVYAMLYSMALASVARPRPWTTESANQPEPPPTP